MVFLPVDFSIGRFFFGELTIFEHGKCKVLSQLKQQLLINQNAMDMGKLAMTASFIFMVLFSGLATVPEGYQLVWSDEFNTLDRPNPKYWSFERGFMRNYEYQWYQEDNAFIENGLLVIEGRREKVKNPNFVPNSTQWRQNREYALYTSSSINTRGKFEFKYGRMEVRARVNTSQGLWPAIWTLGVEGEWPASGEIDIMESYPTDGVQYILANFAWGTNRRWVAHWNARKIPLQHFLDKDPQWPQKFHVWRMDWDEHFIRIYLNDELLNEQDVSKSINPDGSNPFRQPHYILLNMAIGGQHGGDPTNTVFPNRYEVDYVRVFQKK